MVERPGRAGRSFRHSNNKETSNPKRPQHRTRTDEAQPPSKAEEKGYFGEVKAG